MYHINWKNPYCVFQFFVIEGDYIQLREGAQEMIAATAAVAKVAAAAAASSPYSSFLPSVAVTPMAQSRLKKVPSIDSNSVIPNQHLNGVSFGMAGGFSNVKILSKPSEPFELNGANFERSSVISAQSKGSPQGRPNPNFVGKQQSRYEWNILDGYSLLYHNINVILFYDYVTSLLRFICSALAGQLELQQTPADSKYDYDISEIWLIQLFMNMGYAFNLWGWTLVGCRRNVVLKNIMTEKITVFGFWV